MANEIQLDDGNDIDQISTEKRTWVDEIKDKSSQRKCTPMVGRAERAGTFRLLPPGMERVRTCCLLPEAIRTKFDKPDYTPYKLSLGPYHHGHNSCQQTEQIKQTVVVHSLELSKNKSIDHYIECLIPHVQSLKDAYGELDSKWDDNAFLQLMIYDGCFLLEILREARNFYRRSQYGDDHNWNSPIWDIDETSPKELMECYRHDILLFENQIPMLVLEKLSSVQDVENVCGNIRTLVSRKFIIKGAFYSYSYRHVLHLYRHDIVFGERERTNFQRRCCGPFMNRTKRVCTSFQKRCCGPFMGLIKLISITCSDAILMVKTKICGWIRRGSSYETNFEHDKLSYAYYSIPSATELENVGISLRISKTKCLMDITFLGRNLGLPQILVDTTTKAIFPNLIALERLIPTVHDTDAATGLFQAMYGTKVVTSYVYFMSRLIRSADDIRILQSLGIIHSRMLSDDIANLFNSLTTEEIMLDPEMFFVPKYRDMAESLTKSFCKMSIK